MLGKSITAQRVLIHTMLFTAVFFLLSSQFALAQTTNTQTDILLDIVKPIGNMILDGVGYFTGTCAWFLNLAFDLTVLRMGTYLGVGAGGIGNTINTSWEIIRDFCNLFFIFGFIYLGIRTIIDNENANTKKTLTAIIIGALLINFSLFFSKVVIDASNFLAVQLYNQTLGQSPEKGIATIFVTSLKLTSTKDSIKVPNTESVADRNSGSFIAYYLMASIVLIITGIVFLAGAVLLIIRFAALTLIMVFSPLLFAATVFPKTEKLASELWSKLIGYSFFAPAYLFFIVLAYYFSQQISFIFSSNHGFNDAFSGTDQSYLSVVVGFTLIIIFLIFSVVAAQKLSVEGADKVVSTSKLAIGAATVGLAARAGRSTIGKGFNRLAESERFKDWSAQSSFGRSTRRFVQGGATASFDARQVGGLGRNLGIGEGKTGGYAARVAEAKKREEEFVQGLGTVSDDDPRVAARKARMKQREDEIKELRAQMRGADGQERARIQREIYKAEKSLETDRQQYDTEKNRRVLGSTYHAKSNDVVVAKIAMDNAEEALKDQVNKLRDKGSGLSQTELAEAESKISKAAQDLKSKQEAYRQSKRDHGADKGYADVVRDRGFWSSLFEGRNKGINREAGTHLRTEYEKRVRTPKKD